MNRRDFLQQTASAASFLTLTGGAASLAAAATGGQAPATQKPAAPAAGAAKTPAVKHTLVVSVRLQHGRRVSWRSGSGDERRHGWLAAELPRCLRQAP